MMCSGCGKEIGGAGNYFAEGGPKYQCSGRMYWCERCKKWTIRWAV